MADQPDSSIQWPPARSMNDFLLDWARFELPEDRRQLGDRFVKNLLYYQTNYFLMGVAIIVLIGLFRPYEIVPAVCVIMVALYVLRYCAAEASRPYVDIADKPFDMWVALGLVLLCIYVALPLEAILTMVFALYLPFPLMFIHALLRVPIIENGTTNTIEMAGVE
ncbi:PRA1 family protein 2-like [Sabethes cyaneus]|uniref:PRA1 family protein 2-like n=1 Tax=Sabethes cyaneus TaxID=53552 RepID=UPI00237DCA0A|nr:PRA1 family protein 2-like [Sabethes cyaneus]